jgi:nucleotide-binding universal stress UspA family protein
MMESPSRILFADDGTRISRAARQAAFDLALHWNASLHVVTVNDDGLKSSTHQIDDLERICASNNIAHTMHYAAGAASHEVNDLAARIGADLLILGSHRRRDGMSPNGSVGRATLGLTANPVLIVREDTWPPDHIIAGDDGSAEARAAMELAADIGSAFEASALLIDAVPGLRAPQPARELAGVAVGARDEAEQRLSHDAVAVRSRLGGPTTGILSYEPAPVAIRNNVVDAARFGHVLIAVGSSGKSEFQRQLGWSVSARTLDIEVASVLVVPRAWVLEQEGRATQ